MTFSTTSARSPLETLEQELLKADVSVSLLAELKRELFRLRAKMGRAEWKVLCARFARLPFFGTLRSEAGGSLPAGIPDFVTANSFQARPSIAPSPVHTVRGWEYGLPTSRSMRARKAYFAREIAELIRSNIKPRILLLGGNRLNEAEDALQAAHLHHAQFAAVEQGAIRKYPIDVLQLEKGGWSELASLSSKLGKFDLICASSWLEETDDNPAIEWLSAGIEMLRPGGRLLAANCAPGSPDAGWTEACWNWHPYYRSEEYLAKLVLELKNPGVRGHAVYRDETGASVYLEIYAL